MDNAKASPNHKQALRWKLFVASLFVLVTQSPEGPRVLAI